MTEFSFALTGIGDLIVEGTETVVIDITSVTNGNESGTQQQTINILDNDVAEILLSVNTGSLNENGGTALFTVSTSGSVIHTTGIIVTLSYTGTALSGVDYAT